MSSKYKNVKVTTDGITFDSAKEYARFRELRLLEKGKLIRDITLQPRFLILDGFTDNMGEKHRPMYYVADFAYFEKDKKTMKYSKRVVEDVKGMRTEVYKIKKKLFLKYYTDVEFREI